jgi:CheY-like chemotaxis protein/DNA-directed RNA polymerase subunit RPC12/RpoP
MSFAVPAPPELACPACGHRGAPNVLPFQELSYYTCANCGLVVSVRPGVRPNATPSPAVVRRLLIADGSAMLRQAVRTKFAAGPGDQFVECGDGFELLTRYTEAMRAGDRPTAIVMDIAMPILDGRNAALMLRAVEDAFAPSRRSPIIFHTVQPKDEALDKLLTYLGDARHLAKAEAASPAELAASVLAALDEE